MDSTLFEYLAQKVIEDLRSRKLLDKALAGNLNRFPQIDFLRSQLNSADVELLFDLTKSNIQEIQGLAFSLLGGLKNDERVKDFLYELWMKSDQYSVKIRVMWRLLDYPDLEKSLHESIYRFVTDNWNQWIADTSSWHGGPEKILDAMKYRLSDQTIPESKAWAYLCAAFGTTQIGELRNLLKKYSNLKASIVSRVVSDLFLRIGKKAKT